MFAVSAKWGFVVGCWCRYLAKQVVVVVALSFSIMGKGGCG